MISGCASAWFHTSPYASAAVEADSTLLEESMTTPADSRESMTSSTPSGTAGVMTATALRPRRCAAMIASDTPTPTTSPKAIAAGTSQCAGSMGLD
jgi:hypothetical protein